jgi:hypothetical protein
MLARTPLVPPTRRRFVHRRGSLLPVGPATSSPRVDAGQDRSSLYPIGALASLFMLSVLPCLTVRTRARVRDVDAARGTAPPSRLRRPGLCPCRDCVAVLLAIAVVAEPPALTRANPVAAFCTPRTKPKHPDRDHLVALLHLSAENVLPPGRTSVRPSQCSCSSTRTHAGEHPGVPPRSSPFCAPTSCELKPSPPTFSSLPGKPCS